MLLAVIGDVRLVVVRLAGQLQKMRAAKSLEPLLQRKLATETREVYAPLANRLGVWQLKWELEDLAFRYLQPADYKRIAAALKTRRSERERYMEELKTLLQSELRRAGVEATIEGRPKHIYSIWRKMQAKQLAFEQLMDMRAARVLVNTVAECYAALGVVHSLWQFIAGEFDDYIATPKDNLYRSIHTAVIGPGGAGGRNPDPHARNARQFRTRRRGALALQGGRPRRPSLRAQDQSAALAAVAGRGRRGTPRDFLDRMRVDLFQDRIYVLSPKGEIVDVPVGGTPLDFAYQVHTDLGHRTRGAKVNGRMVALDYQLKNSETVEIITAKAPHPSRDWLSPQSGFLASPRHRNKVRAWFRKQNETQNKTEGRALFDREIQRLGVGSPPIPELLERTEAAEHGNPARGLGIGRSKPGTTGGSHPANSARARRPARPSHPSADLAGRARAGHRGSRHRRLAVDLLRAVASPCRPSRSSAISRWAEASAFMRSRAPISAASATNPPLASWRSTWGKLASQEFPVEIEVEAFDRRGLVRDVSAALADDKISILGMNTVTDKRDNVAHMQIKFSITGLAQLSQVLGRIAQLANVISARRKK